MLWFFQSLIFSSTQNLDENIYMHTKGSGLLTGGRGQSQSSHVTPTDQLTKAGKQYTYHDTTTNHAPRHAPPKNKLEPNPICQSPSPSHARRENSPESSSGKGKSSLAIQPCAAPPPPWSSSSSPPSPEPPRRPPRPAVQGPPARGGWARRSSTRSDRDATESGSSRHRLSR
jgi:hypothetical protein